MKSTLTGVATKPQTKQYPELRIYHKTKAVGMFLNFNECIVLNPGTSVVKIGFHEKNANYSDTDPYDGEVTLSNE